VIKPLRDTFRISAAKQVGRKARNAKRSPRRRIWTTERCRFVDIGYRRMARFALHAVPFRSKTVWQVSELNSGLRVSMELTQDEAIYQAAIAVVVRSQREIDRAIRRAVHQCGRANRWRKAWRS